MRRLAVILCTRNRAALLSKALESFKNCRVPDDWTGELVVVDNGSTDETPAVVARVSELGRWRVRSVTEPCAGISRARNAGLRATDAGVIAFTDDDCRVAEDWIVNVIRVFEEHPSVAALFGRVEAPAGAETARTVAVKTEMSAREYSFGMMPGQIGHGNNMAFRGEALKAAGPFDEALGTGGPLRAAEDLDMAYRLLRRGGTVRYDPSCRVVHEMRESVMQVRATHWRNAIGMGACYGKHALRGDGFAWKCLLWLWADLPLAALREAFRGRGADLYAKWAYFWGLPEGFLKRMWLDRGCGKR